MSKEFNTSATFTKGARVVSDYKNDMVFEQPRDGLVQQEFVYPPVKGHNYNYRKQTPYDSRQEFVRHHLSPLTLS